MSILTWLLNHWQDVLTTVVSVLTAFVALFMLIPGDQPERTLQKIVDFIEKFSRK